MRKAKPIYPKGFEYKAALKSPSKICPTDLVLPQNGQGNPVTFLNRHRDGPVLKPSERIANTLARKRKARSINRRIGNLTRCSLSISSFEIKNWAVRFIVNLTAQSSFLEALCFDAKYGANYAPEENCKDSAYN